MGSDDHAHDGNHHHTEKSYQIVGFDVCTRMMGVMSMSQGRHRITVRASCVARREYHEWRESHHRCDTQEKLTSMRNAHLVY